MECQTTYHTGCYDELRLSDLTDIASGWPRGFDVVCCAETLIYFGDLGKPLPVTGFRHPTTTARGLAARALSRRRRGGPRQPSGPVQAANGMSA